WQDKRSERVHRLEAELAAAKERRKADETTNGDASPTPDYGSMLESEQENDSSDSDARSESSSLFYTEGQPLLCTYQPLAYPGGISANYGATPATAPPKSPEQYLPWDRRSTMQIFVYPPLGTLTSVHKPQVRFRVYFAYSLAERVCAEAGKVEIWTNIYDDEWQGIPLEHVVSDDTHPELIFIDLKQLEPASSMLQFSLDIDVAALPAHLHRFEFTVRWRSSHLVDWKWVSGFEHNASVIVYRPLPRTRAPVSFWQQQLKAMLKPTAESELTSPGYIADSWHASSSGASCIIRPQSSDNDILCQMAAVERYLAFVRKDHFWIIPQYGSSSIETGKFEVVILLVELSSGVYAALMPFSLGSAASHGAVLTVQPSNYLCLQPVSRIRTESVRVAVGFNLDPHTAIQDAMRRVQQSLPPIRGRSTSLPEPAPAHTCSLDRNRGYCTWNGFYQNVTHDGLISTLSAIRNAANQRDELPFGWVLIDDGWQTVDKYDGYGRLHDIYANSEKFPGQLKQTANSLTKLGIQRVGVWHTLWGYWGGIDPAGPLAERYKLVKCHRKWTPVVKSESDVWLISPESVYAFYDSFYFWLSEQGVSFVKVDYQAAFESLDSYDGRSSDASRKLIIEMYDAYYNAMEHAALKYFGRGSIVYCMAQSPHLITRAMRLQQQCTTEDVAAERMMFRNSDDYFPDVITSHGWHLNCNMTNTVWSRCLSKYFIGDWDMFQPQRAESHVHAVARIVSGGLVYMTGRAADFTADSMCDLGINEHMAPHAQPLLDSDCLFADMTKLPAILVSTIVVPGNDSVVIALFNVSSDLAVTPMSLCSMYSTAIERQNGIQGASFTLSTAGIAHPSS
ncbi:hypothetical protein EV176_004798, partial [Coemansia sp. RSA 451]